MQYMFIGLALSFGLIAFGALCLSIFSYMRLNGHMELVVRILNSNNREITTVRSSMDAVYAQNKQAMEQNKKSSDHQRVLLASLNRQLIKLDQIFSERQVSMPAEHVALATQQFVQPAPQQQPAPQYQPAPQHQHIAQQQPVPQYSEQDLEVAAHREAIARQQAVAETSAHHVAANSQSHAAYTSPERPSPAAQAKQQLASRKHRPLDSLVNRISDVEPTGARIPLAQRIRINNRSNAPAEQVEKPQQTKNGPVIRTRETIDVLKMKERRVANG